jgi:oligopeptide transport system substrate-binding protein
VVDSANAESGQYWWLEPNGTGPFTLKEWTQGWQLVLERSEIYYGDPAKLRSIVFSLTAADPMALYETGQIDVVPVYLDYIDAVSDATNPFHLELAVTPELSLYYIGFNAAEPPFDDVNVRRAFCRTVDKEHIVRVILRDMVSVADGILPPEMPGYDEALEGLDHSVEEARDLIAASQYGDVSNLPPIRLTVAGYGNNIPSYLGAIIQEWQQNLGVEVSVRQVETDRLIYNLKEEKDEMFTLGWIADYPDPHSFLDVLFYTGSEVNIGEYSNPALDALLEQAAIEQNVTDRLAMYQQAEQLVVDDAPCVPLWHNTNYILVKPYVKGYELSAQGIPDLSNVYMGAG